MISKLGASLVYRQQKNEKQNKQKTLKTSKSWDKEESHRSCVGSATASLVECLGLETASLDGHGTQQRHHCLPERTLTEEIFTLSSHDKLPKSSTDLVTTYEHYEKKTNWKSHQNCYEPCTYSHLAGLSLAT